MLAYSPEAEPGRAYLLRRYNDIDIYVEDVSAQNTYVRLFQRALAGVAKISHVFPLHDKDRVIEACAADQDPQQRKRLYVIDGDFALIQGAPPPPLRHLYRLQVYSCENLLLSEAAAIQIAMECRTSDTWEQNAGLLDLRNLFERAYQLLMPLFIVYAIAEQIGTGVKTSKYKVQRLCQEHHRPETLSSRLVRCRISEVRKSILTRVDIVQYRTMRQTYQARVGTETERFGRFISGKSYLLPLLHLRLKRQVGFQGDIDSLKVRLAAHCELTIDAGLVTAVHEAMG